MEKIKEGGLIMGKTSTKRVKDDNIDETGNTSIEETKISEGVVDNEPLVAPKEPEVIKGRVVSCKKLNIRQDPKSSSKPLCVVNAGDVLVVNNVRSKNAKWYSVTTKDGTRGYCMSDYIEIVR